MQDTGNTDPTSPTPTGRQTFRKHDRMRARSDFESAFADRQNVRNRTLTIYYRKNDSERPRLGLSVGRRLGGAVTRNRIKRVMREVFRLERDCIPGSMDIVVIPRHPETAVRFEDMRSAFVHLMGKIGEKGRDLS